ncbi:MAG: FAD-binding oxidoreductase [Gemmatimonadaceae bacterium]
MRPTSLLVAEELVPNVRGSASESHPPLSVQLAPDSVAIADFLHDESKLAAARVASLATPRSVDELRQVMTWHAALQHRVAVSGTRTGVVGGAVPEDGAHLVSLAELRGVLRVDETGESPTVTVLAGTWLSELSEYLAAHHAGLAFPIDPTERSASFGGMVSTNAGGARSFRFGSIRSWVVGVTVELPSGRTLRLRRGVHRAAEGRLRLQDGAEERELAIAPIPKPSTKNAVGPGFAASGDALDLWIGAEGTLGVISEVEVRLVRESGSRLGYLQFFGDVLAAFRFVEGLRASSALQAIAIEFLDARSHALARESGRDGVERVLRLAPPDACSVFTEIDFEGDDALVAAIEALDALVTSAGGDATASLAGTNERELKDIRAFRHAVPERVNAIIAQRREQHPGVHKIATDMSVPDGELHWIFGEYQRRLTAAGLDFAAFGHVGNNHFHVNMLPRDESEVARARTLYEALARDVVARGGAVAAEHGIGRIKKAFLPVQYDAAVLRALRAVKSWVDPEWRLNPGILLDPAP